MESILEHLSFKEKLNKLRHEEKIYQMYDLINNYVGTYGGINDFIEVLNEALCLKNQECQEILNSEDVVDARVRDTINKLQGISNSLNAFYNGTTGKYE